MGGCVVSVDPYLSDADVTFDPGLLGTWEEVSGSDRAVVSQRADDAYAVEYTSDGEVTQFEARLGRLGDRLVLDLWPAADDSDQDLESGLEIPGHLLLTVDIGSNEIRFAAIDPDPLLESLRDGRIGLSYQSADEQLILQGSTEQLRAALGDYIERDGALTDPDAWRRADPQPALDPVPVSCFEASPWREADRLFRGEPNWLGADVASTVDLGDGRVLWLFGDTWIDPTGAGTRRGASLISNSVAIQTGTDPTTSAIEFYWGRHADGSPDALFPDRGAESLWFGNGVRGEGASGAFRRRYGPDVRNEHIRVAENFSDSEIYYPRFVRLTRCD